jgi:drug/metabolite transporter (DMT)-like permease
MSRSLPWIILLVVSAVWGGAFTAIRLLVLAISPADLLIARFIPTTILALLWLFAFYRKAYMAILPRFWLLFVILSTIWLFGYHYVLNVGETVLPASVGGLIIATYPIFTVFLAAPFLKEKLTWPKVVGGLIAFAGTGFLTLYGAGEEGAQLDIPPAQWIQYSLLTFLSPIAAAVHTLIARPFLTGNNRHHVKMDPVVMTLAYMAPGGILSLALYNPGVARDVAGMSTQLWLALAFLVIFCTIGAYIGWFWALTRVEAGPASIFTYIIPIFTIAYARIWLDEPIGLPIIVGAAGIVVGVIVAGMGGRFQKGNHLK